MNSVKQFSKRKAILALVLAAVLCLGFVLSPYGGVWASAQQEEPEPATQTEENTPEGYPSDDDGLPIIIIPPEQPDENNDGVSAEEQEQEKEEDEEENKEENKEENETDAVEAGEQDKEQPAEAVEGDKDEDEDEEASQQNRGAGFAMPSGAFSTPVNVASSQDIQNAIDAETSGVLTLNITQNFGMGADPIVINKDITIYFTATGGPVTVTAYAAEAYHRYFNIPSGKVNLIFDKDNIKWYGYISESVVGGGFDIGPNAEVFVTGLDMEQARIDYGSANSPYPEGGGGGFFVQGKLEIADSLLVAMTSFNKSGGGFFVDNGGQLKISGTPTEPVTIKRGIAGGNFGEGGGGGIHVAKGGSLDATHLVVTALTDNHIYDDADVGGKVISGKGGAIYWEVDASAKGKQSLTNSILSFGSASSGGGGAYIVVNKGATLHAVENTVFDGNTSMYPGGGLRLDNYGTIESFTNNSFINNVSYSGSAMHITGDSPLTITNTAIDNNRGVNSYGLVKVASSAGILNENTQLTIEGSDTSISGNVIEAETGGPPPSGGNGAGIYVLSGEVVFADGVIANNIAKVNGGGVYVAAGASFLQTGGSIQGNNAVTNGGGIYVAADASFLQTGGSIQGNDATLGGGVYIAQDGEAELRGGTIEANTTTGGGGGAAVHNLGTLYITGTTIQKHTGAEKNGTVMLGDGSTGFMSGGLITQNTLTSVDSEGSLGRGAGIYLRVGASFTMTGGTISHNTADRGAGIYVQENSTLSINGGTIEENNALLFGGGIYLLRNNRLVLDGQNNLLIRGNTAGIDGGAIVSYGQPDPLKPTVRADNTITINETGGSLVIDGNHADNTGGAIHIRLGSQDALNITGGTFTNNSADKEGGAIYLDERTIVATINGGNIGVKDNGNHAGTDGGGIYNSAANLTIKGSTSVSGNTAARNGGGISSDLGKNTFLGTAQTGSQTTGPLFADNTAGGNGGGIHITNGTLEMKYVSLKDNGAASGGGMYVVVGQLTDSDPLGDAEEIESIDNNVFSGNTATQDGGGLYVYIRSNGLSNSISGNVVENNAAGRDGGGVYAAYYGEGKRISDNTVSGNTAGGNGGGLYILGTMRRYFAITSDSVVGNEAKGNGGGVFVSNTILRVYNTPLIPGQASISGNTAANGGGIYAADNAKVVVEQGKIENNTATTGNGGGIYSNAALVPASQLSNDPETGTLKYENILVEVDIAKISGNKAENGNGGGIYIGQKGGLKLRGSTVDGNRAKSGGGVYIATFGVLDINTSDETDTGDRTSFRGNTATMGNGGGLYVGNGALDLQYADLVNNRAEKGNGGGAYITLQADEYGPGSAQMMVYNRFEENRAINGGGMYIIVLEGATSDVIGGNDLINNTATEAGGGVWIRLSGSGKSVYQNTIQGNTARIGGGAYLTGTPQDKNTMSFANDSFLDNHATENGGGIYVYNSALLLFDAEAANAAIPGAYVKLNGEEVEGHTHISGNTAAADKDNPAASNTGNGGGIYLYNSTLQLQIGTISGNTAALNGGGIYAGEGSVIAMNYNSYADKGVAPSFKLDLLGNTAAKGNGGGMYIVPSATKEYDLKNLTVQSNKAEEGDGGGIYAAKARLQYLTIDNSLFGTPDTTQPDTTPYNVARDTSYVKLLETPDQFFIDLHPVNLTGLTGHSPSEAGDWARLTASDASRLYYNNFDIAFTAAEENKYTVNYYANGGYFADYSNAIHISGQGYATENVYAPVDSRHDEASFIGWFRDTYTAEEILENFHRANEGLNRSNGWRYMYTFTGRETREQDFYAAWLFAPTVELAYDVDTQIVVRSLKDADDVTLYIDGEKINVTGSHDGNGNWTFDLDGVMELEEGMDVQATQTITIYDVEGNSPKVVSPKGKNTVLPTYSVYYHINADVTAEEEGRLIIEWLPTDVNNPYKSSAEKPLRYNVLGPQDVDKGRSGYNFLGWTTSPTGGTPLNNGDTGTIYDADVHLYAQWETLYTLTYHANTRVDSADEALKDLLPASVADIEAGTAVPIGDWAKAADELRPADDTYAYRFLYWTADAGGNGVNHYLYNGQRADGHYNTITVNEDRDLYAQWQRSSRIIYNWNYTGAPTDHNIVDRGYYALGEDFEVQTAKPDRQGYTFIGWNYYPNADPNRWYEPGKEYPKPDEGTTTLYAHWVPNITIDYDGNGHTDGDEPEGEDDWTPGDEYAIKDEGTLERDGYVFKGWSKDKDSSQPEYYPGDKIYPEEDTTLYAIWKLATEPDIIKDSGEEYLVAGQTFAYTISVTNHSKEVVDAVVTDDLPDYLKYVESDANNLGNETSLRFESKLDPGETWYILVTVTLAEDFDEDQVENTATAVFNDDPGLTASDNDETPVIKKPVITKDADRQIVLPGDTFIYTISVQNTGKWAVNAVVTDDLPSGLIFKGSDSENLGSKTSLRFEDSIEPGDTWIIAVEVTLDEEYEGEAIENTARVVFNSNPALSDEDDEETLVGLRPEPVAPEITKASNRQAVLPGNSFTYTLTVRNLSEQAVNAVVTDALPEGLTYKGGNHENLGSETALRFEKPMEGGETWVITVDVALAADYSGSTIHNVATAAFNEAPGVTAEDDDDTPVGLLPQPVAPEITKTSGEESLAPGQSFTYTITVRNSSAQTVQAVVTDTLPDGLAYKGSSETPAQNGQALRWEKPLGPGEAWEILVHVTLDAGYTAESIENTAVAVFNGDDSLTARDSDTTPVTLPGAPPPAENSTPTGDAAQLMLWTCIALAALFSMGSMIFVNIRRRQLHRKRFAWYYRSKK